MPKRYIVATGHEFNYSANPETEKIVQAAGGRHKLSDADRLKVKFKTVVAGEDCSDMPATVLALYAERGWALEVNDSVPALQIEPVVETEFPHVESEDGSAK